MARSGVLGATSALLLTASCAMAAVGISPTDDGWQVTGSGYSASVGQDGALTSLQVGGLEFLYSAADFPRGAYAWQDGLVRLTQVTRDGDRIIAKDAPGRAEYRFGDTGVTLALTNDTDRDMLLVVVLAKGVRALADDDGRLRKSPTEASTKAPTWYQLPAKLRMTGGQRAWGPWGDGYQVWQATVPAKQTSTITMEAGMASPDEQQSVQAEIDRVVEPPTDPVGPMWDLERFGKAPTYGPADGYEWAETAPGVQPIFFEGPAFRGKPTRVFAWLGVPEVPAGETLPGMVLVDGGGGTAFAHWVKMWNDRGYAAIAMDTCGCVPVGTYGNWQRLPDGGPEGWGGWGQIDDPREDQWTFHAVADALLAHSLLRSLPEVDPDRIGVTGISWGGYLTSLIAGVDSRFAFAAPVYGCGHTLDMTFGESVRALGPEKADRWMRWWDPSSYLASAQMPILWMNGTNDFAYTLSGWQKSYRQPQGPRTLSLHIRMPHGHTEGEVPEEIHAFADGAVGKGPGLCRVTGQRRDGNEVYAAFAAAVPMKSAELCYTKATGPWTDRLWETLPATLSDGQVTATLPEGTTCYFLNLIDERDLIVSTEHEELP
jgi:dienelactone hydrolase